MGFNFKLCHECEESVLTVHVGRYFEINKNHMMALKLFFTSLGLAGGFGLKSFGTNKTSDEINHFHARDDGMKRYTFCSSKCKCQLQTVSKMSNSVSD